MRTFVELINEEDCETGDKALANADLSDVSKAKSKPMNNLSFPPLPSVFETDSNDSDIEEVLETFEKVKPAVQMPAKLAFDKSKSHVSSLPTTCTTIDARLEIGLSSMSEIGLQRLTTANTHKLLENILEDRVKEEEMFLVPWAEQVGPFAPESNQTTAQMLAYCFNELLNKLQTMSPQQIENVLHLWVTLNCMKRDSKFDASATPIIRIQAESVVGLISALAWTPGLSLKTWCLGLQVSSSGLCKFKLDTVKQAFQTQIIGKRNNFSLVPVKLLYVALSRLSKIEGPFIVITNNYFTFSLS